MGRYLILFLSLFFVGFANSMSQPIISVDGDKATIKIDNIDVGMSGFVVKHLNKEHSIILKNAVVSGFDKKTKIATLKLSDYDALKQNSLPSGKWKVSVGDEVVLAFGYSRALLIAPNEEIYHRITKALPTLEWVHPDLFATVLSFNGHPTPLKEDFNNMCSISSAGLLYFYIHENLFTLDCKSMTILQITKAPLKQESLQLPFYSRVEQINANWFGSGSSKLKAYDPYYYELLVKNNPKNKELYDLIKNKEQKLSSLLDDFDMKDEK
ncbi:plasminogen-binding N-terminal domain-containing protein [Sulfurimonas sp. HSL-1716]|uniref:plasminogen-binding N-terminal domain-containing protein n=1 Tax=Hydrocurvibacter sulfurireducens TaxID=3131937 RepID=UPI0031F8CAE7